MAMFLEERLYENIDYGSSFANEYATKILQAAGGDEFRSQLHPYVVATISVVFERQTKFILDKVVDLNNRAGGSLRAFRVMHPADYTTNNYRDAPTAFDQPMILANPNIPGVYQIMRWYGDTGDNACARRRVRKPVAGTVLVGVAGTALPSSQWTVDNTTGLVTITAKNDAINGITKGATTSINANGHPFVAGELVHISGVAGMTQINGMRGTVLSRDTNNFVINVNSTAFTDYVSGGTVNTSPQAGESVTAGCQFDIPMRFNDRISGNFSNWDTIDMGGSGLTEVLNP